MIYYGVFLYKPQLIISPAGCYSLRWQLLLRMHLSNRPCAQQIGSRAAILIQIPELWMTLPLCL